MIPFLRRPAALTAFAALLLLGSDASVRAADDDAAARKAAADEVLTSLHMQQFVEATTKRIIQSLDTTVDRLEKQAAAKPEQTADANTLREELHTMVAQQVNWDAMKPDFVQTYADDFTEEELKAISAFYHTPAGIKLAEKQPDLTDKVSKTIQQRASVIAPAVQQKIRAIAMKLRPAPPVLSPAPGTPGAPGAPAVTSPVAAPTAALPLATPVVPATPATPPPATPRPVTPPNP